MVGRGFYSENRSPIRLFCFGHTQFAMSARFPRPTPGLKPKPQGPRPNPSPLGVVPWAFSPNPLPNPNPIPHGLMLENKFIMDDRTKICDIMIEDLFMFLSIGITICRKFSTIRI
ncbi:hypothetical protein Hanom_Chr12g01074271 [Helianthus anomalus]